MKVLFSGTRSVYSLDLIQKGLFRVKKTFPLDSIDEIVSGDASGVDAAALDYAKKNGIAHKRFLADRGRYGKGAGPRLNEEMVAYIQGGGVAVFIPDNKSKGTWDCFRKATQRNISCIVVRDLLNK